jgi:hypothetical protein
MKLEELYENFIALSPPQQEQFLKEYFVRRSVDLTSPDRFIAQNKRKSATPAVFTDDEKRLMKMLGLKQKDILQLRESIPGGEEEDDEDDELEVE